MSAASDSIAADRIFGSPDGTHSPHLFNSTNSLASPLGETNSIGKPIPIASNIFDGITSENAASFFR